MMAASSAADKAGAGAAKPTVRAETLLDELRRLAKEVRKGPTLPAEDLGAFTQAWASAIESAADGFAEVVRQLEARSGARPTHFVGLRMPPHVRDRLERLQNGLLVREPSLAKAAVSMAKAHVTLLVTRVEAGSLTSAKLALDEAAKEWCSAEGRSLQTVSVAKTDHFPTGVLFAPMSPVESIAALRKYVVHAFARHGFPAMDEKAEEEEHTATQGAPTTLAASAGAVEETARGSDAVCSDTEIVSEERSGKDDAGGESSCEEASNGQDAGVDGQDADANLEEDGKSPHGELLASTDGGDADAVGKELKQKRRRRGDRGEYLPHVTLFKCSQAGRGRSGKKDAATAKRAILRVAKALDPKAKESINFGAFPIAICELVDMRATQEDGYYEVLAEARFAPGNSADDRNVGEAEKGGGRTAYPEQDWNGGESEKSKEEQRPEEHNTCEADFAAALTALGASTGAEGEKRKLKKAGKGKAAGGATWVPVAQSETSGEEEANAEDAQQTTSKKKKKRQKRGAKPEAETFPQPSGITQDADEEWDLEMRIDPEDGSAYTWEEFSAYYVGKYKKALIAAYWEECEVLPIGRSAPGKKKAARRGGKGKPKRKSDS